MDVPIVDWVDRVSLSEAVCMRTHQNQHRNNKKKSVFTPLFCIYVPFWSQFLISKIMLVMSSPEYEEMELEGFPRAWIPRKTRRGHVVAFAGCDGIICPSLPLPQVQSAVYIMFCPALQVHLTIGCILFKSHFPSILQYTIELISQKTKKSTPLVCAIIFECAIVEQVEWTCSQLMACNLDISKIYGMQEWAFSLGYSSVSDKDK